MKEIQQLMKAWLLPAWLLAMPVYAEIADDEALDLARAMAYGERSYGEIVLTLIVEGRSLPEATYITMLATESLPQRQALAQTVLCMSRNVEEAQEVVKQAISALPKDDPAVQAIVSEHVKYQRSSCIDSDILKRPPVNYASNAENIDVSPSR